MARTQSRPAGAGASSCFSTAREALRLCVSLPPDERASDFAAWLRRLKGSIHE